MEIPEQDSPKLFISYSHDSHVHKDLVLELANSFVRTVLMHISIGLNIPHLKVGHAGWLHRYPGRSLCSSCVLRFTNDGSVEKKPLVPDWVRFGKVR